ncbi:uncharacterized protein LOC113273159 [Papaver somniferum]|uniref:uncharacterized protein LOC113273159 n=1 Tax=Papaver somniferum TaxID=3469 RepID=UPI000E6F8602|nr:uncharacterized protein LOC113273159 [Papaver somniferum]
MEHVLFQCSFEARAWLWISNTFGLTANFELVVSFRAAKSRIKIVLDMWLVENLVFRSELWAMRNNYVFDRKKMNWNIFYKRVLNLIQDYSLRLKGDMKNCAEDIVLLDYFRVAHRRVKHQDPVEFFWNPPEDNELQICCDGAEKGIPGIAGAGVVARDAHCSVLGPMSIGLGVTTNYLAELYGILIGLEWAMQRGFDPHELAMWAKNNNSTMYWSAPPVWLLPTVEEDH